MRAQDDTKLVPKCAPKENSKDKPRGGNQRRPFFPFLNRFSVPKAIQNRSQWFKNRSKNGSRNNIESKAVSNPILKRFFMNSEAGAEAKILQNTLRGVQNQTLRIYDIER